MRCDKVLQNLESESQVGKSPSRAHTSGGHTVSGSQGSVVASVC